MICLIGLIVFGRSRVLLCGAWTLAILSLLPGALRWVQREIAAFGGDATKVAIHGQSSGAGYLTDAAQSFQCQLFSERHP